MKNFKLGFTLSEILLALGVISVIAALTFPSLSKDMQKRQSAMVASRVFQKIETGNRAIFEQARSNGVYTESLSDIRFVDLYPNGSTDSLTSNLADIIPQYWGLSPETIPIGDVKPAKHFNGATCAVIQQRIAIATRFNFQGIPASIAIISYNGLAMGTGENTTIAHLFIDTNGFTVGPNSMGKDLFYFRLGNNGRLEPVATGCVGDYTRQLVEDGFKINYY